MRLLDIHSHILPNVDDGAKDVAESIKLLEICKEQGITDIIATPHFDASVHNIDEFHYIVNEAYEELNAARSDDLPEVYLGSEVYYFKGIGKSSGIRSLTLCGSRYILLELPIAPIKSNVLNDITDLYESLGLIPIIAHIERYSDQKGFKDLIKLLSSGIGYAQVNAASVISAPFKRTVMKLMKNGHISFVASDMHSVKHRPPLMREALNAVAAAFGEDYKAMFIKNGEFLYKTIIGGSYDKQNG